MRNKAVVLSTVALLLAMASVAEAHGLSLKDARKEIKRHAVSKCEGDCIAIVVNECQRRSAHRVSCHVHVDFRDESGCSWRSNAFLPPGTSKVRVRDKHIVCGPS
ncbi:MAG TPA: hypothetical protein VFU04_08320 [Solirubrobacterales bacterium]|nr:hypothetical protein [Solirubrobacterales bacterium]